MEEVCVHCGQTFEAGDKSSAETMACPACGKPTPIAAAVSGAPELAGAAPTAPDVRPWFKGRDILIGAVILAVLTLLALLFLKPPQPVRDLVFGDLGAGLKPTNNVATNAEPLASSGGMTSNSTAVISPNPGSPNPGYSAPPGVNPPLPGSAAPTPGTLAANPDSAAPALASPPQSPATPFNSAPAVSAPPHHPSAASAPSPESQPATSPNPSPATPSSRVAGNCLLYTSDAAD